MRKHRSLLILIILIVVAIVFLAYLNRRHLPVPNQTRKITAGVSSPTPSATPTSTAYVVQPGDSLYTIGQHFGIPWDTIAKINGLSDNASLQQGQILQIPTQSQALTVQAKTYIITPDSEEEQVLQEAQAYANAGTGQLAYRLVPSEVVEQSPLLARFQFSPNDLYVQKSVDLNNGTAIVEVTHESVLYTVYLDQPLQKGSKGVWTPVKVTAPF